MMAIVRVMPSKTAAIVEKARIYLASLGLLGGTDPVEKQRVEAWCYRGKTVWRKQEAQASTPSAIALSRVAPGRQCPRTKATR